MSTQEPLPILDDVARVQSVDRRYMLRLINDLPEQCETALGIGRNFTPEELAQPPNVVYITGVGDSGLGASFAVATVSPVASVPVVAGHGPRVPGYVGEKSLVIAIDYAGDSATTLQAYREAKLRGATVICATSGGALGSAASEDGTKTIRIPGGQPARTAIGYILLPVVAALERLGVAQRVTEELSSAIKLTKNVREMFRFEVPYAHNLAKQIAGALVGKVPFIYAASGYRMPIAERWKSQIGANAKSLAACGVFPGAVQGQVCAWEQGGKTLQDSAIVFLRDPLDKDTEIADLIDITKAILADYPVLDVELRGGSTAEKLLYGMYLGDYVSCYLALAYGVDPSVCDSVRTIEMRLAERRTPPPPPPEEEVEEIVEEPEAE